MSDAERSTPALEATMLSRSSLQGTRAAADATQPGMPDPLIGNRLRHFQVTALLGRGGMGAVYLGHDTSLERPVAIKVLGADVAHDPEIVARFVREARAQARLRHPNVAQIYFIGEDRGLHFSVMEYIQGPALDEVLRRQQRIDWGDAIEHTIAAARGLRAALEHGFIHRDIKPSNLMLDRESGIKILDFGLVKSLHGDAQLTRDGAIVGSPLYMSPEQGRGDDVDHRSDMYSLGCALYHMLTGQPPFSGPSPVGVIAKHVTDLAPPVRSFAPDVPEAVARIVERLMAKSPEGRFATYDELIAALENERPGKRELSGFRARAGALGIDLALLLVVAAFAGIWATPVAVVYFVLMHRFFGQTVGKRLFRLEVVGPDGQRPSWKVTLLRFAAFAWGPLAWTILGAVVFFVHRDDRVAFQLSRLHTGQLLVPLVYASIAAAVFVGYLAGFLVAAFHPRRLALHDLLVRTEVRHRLDQRPNPLASYLARRRRTPHPTR